VFEVNENDPHEGLKHVLPYYLCEKKTFERLVSRMSRGVMKRQGKETRFTLLKKRRGYPVGEGNANAGLIDIH